MSVRIVNEDILDEKEPIIYVQRYFTPHMVYQVFRKPVSKDEVFIVSEGAEQRLWCVSSVFIDPEPYNPDEYDDLPEIFALIYLDEENPPVDFPDECEETDPCVSIVYDLETHLYRCEATFVAYEAVDTISAPALQEAIDKGIATLDELLSKANN